MAGVFFAADGVGVDEFDICENTVKGLKDERRKKKDKLREKMTKIINDHLLHVNFIFLSKLRPSSFVLQISNLIPRPTKDCL
jgi:hypothetical protein